MTPIAIQTLLQTMPPIVGKVDEPKDPNGRWWIDLLFNGQVESISWNPNVGWEFYPMNSTAYGELPEKVICCIGQAITEVKNRFNLRNHGRQKFAP